MKHQIGFFSGVRGTNIYYQAWLPEGEPRAVLLLVHGLAEHSGRYMNVVNTFVPKGYAVYGLDHSGHGKSGTVSLTVPLIGNEFDLACIRPELEYFSASFGKHPESAVF